MSGIARTYQDRRHRWVEESRTPSPRQYVKEEVLHRCEVCNITSVQSIIDIVEFGRLMKDLYLPTIKEQLNFKSPLFTELTS